MIRMRIGSVALCVCSAAFALALTPACASNVSTAAPGATDAGTSVDAGDAVPQIAPPTTDHATWDVAANGPFHVGYRTVQTSYTTPNGATRSFDVNIWYPTLDDDGTTPKYNDIFYDSKAYVDASLAASVYAGGKYPVQIYSHGDRGYPDNSAFLMRHFASHGWVAIAPRHVGNTLGDTPATKPQEIYYLRGLDIKASLDLLEKLPSSDVLAGKTDTTRVVMTGHSFGSHSVWTVAGAPFDVDGLTAKCKPATGTPTMAPCTDADLTAFRAGVKDPRVISGFTMAGTLRTDWTGAHGESGVNIPMFFMSGTDDQIGQSAFYDSIAPFPFTWVDVQGACHLFFSTGKCNNIADAKQVPIVGSFAMAFARKTLMNDSTQDVSDTLAGRKNDPAVVTFQVR